VGGPRWRRRRLHGLLLSVMTAKASHAGKQENKTPPIDNPLSAPYNYTHE